MRLISNPTIYQDREFDLVVCLEVAEHLLKNNASSFIDYISSFAPIIFFSAAVPGQGGANHINEQWPEYWSKLFFDRGFQCLDIIRPLIWNNSQVEPWYSQNSFLYIKTSHISCFTKFDSFFIKKSNLTEQYEIPFRIIHPELFRRFTSLEYVQTKKLITVLLKRIKRKFFRRRKQKDEPRSS